MAGIVVDYHLNGWAKENESRIGKGYSSIHYVGDLPDLPRDTPDPEVAAYCTARGCDLLTSDKEAYISWLKKGVAKAVRISIFGTNEQAEQTVYLVRAA